MIKIPTAKNLKIPVTYRSIDERSVFVTGLLSKEMTEYSDKGSRFVPGILQFYNFMPVQDNHKIT